MIEPVVTAPGPSSSHIGCFDRTCVDSWIHRLVSSQMPLCCKEGDALRLSTAPVGRLSWILDAGVILTLW